MSTLILWIIFWTLIGSLGTYFVYQYQTRDPQTGAGIGAVAGLVGGPVLLLPLWFYTYTHRPQLQAAGSLADIRLPEPKPSVRFPIQFKPIFRLLIYAFLIFLMVVYLLPIYTVVTTSLKTPQEAGKLDQVWELPSTIEWSKSTIGSTNIKIPLPESYVTALEELGPKLRNSFILTITATALSAVMGSLNGYVLSKWKFPGVNIIFPLMLFGMFIPYQSILIPLFQFIQDINLGGTLYGLIMAHVVYGLPITTLIFRNYYAEVPTEMLEAGSIDGAGFYGIYRWIVFPLSLPGFVVVIIWQFTQIWNEFLFAVTLTNQKSQPITVALALLAGGEAVNWNLPMAGAVLAALPTLLVYIVLGRYFIRGLLAGSVKG
jgi:glucose/mannose transport system permease protein